MLKCLVEDELPLAAIIARGHDQATVERIARQDGSLSLRVRGLEPAVHDQDDRR